MRVLGTGSNLGMAWISRCGSLYFPLTPINKLAINNNRYSLCMCTYIQINLLSYLGNGVTNLSDSLAQKHKSKVTWSRSRRGKVRDLEWQTVKHPAAYWKLQAHLGCGITSGVGTLTTEHSRTMEPAGPCRDLEQNPVKTPKVLELQNQLGLGGVELGLEQSPGGPNILEFL